MLVVLLVTFWLVALSCEPLTASFEVLLMSPAATLVILSPLTSSPLMVDVKMVLLPLGSPTTALVEVTLLALTVSNTGSLLTE